jgi:hypothetical protein
VGAIAESPIEPGLLFAGTDRGAFWMTPDDGRHWTEHSQGLSNGYIRSICPSRFDKARIYVTVTGINDDDLGNHLYVSNDYGKTWQSMVANLPDEVAYAILEDPVNEDILYAGLYRGVYISVDRGKRWSLLGPGMAATAISDLVVQERDMDLVVGTHGRGIYKMNLRPLHEALKNGLPETDILFDPPMAHLPNTSPTEKVPITFYLMHDAAVELQLHNDKGETIWTKSIKGQKGFNQYRWDLVVKHNNSPEPYFWRYLETVQAGEYKLTVVGNGIDLKTNLTIVR